MVLKSPYDERKPLWEYLFEEQRIRVCAIVDEITKMEDIRVVSVDVDLHQYNIIILLA